MRLSERRRRLIVIASILWTVGIWLIVQSAAGRSWDVGDYAWRLFFLWSPVWGFWAWQWVSSAPPDPEAALDEGSIGARAPAQKWIKISPVDAGAHPLYGVSGWALVLLILLIVGFAYGLSTMSELWSFLLRRNLHTLAFGIVVHLSLIATMIGLMLFAQRKFQILFTFAWAANAFITILFLASASNIRGVDASDILPDVIRQAIGAVWLIYIWRSRRINVTYALRVRKDDPFFAKRAQPEEITVAL